METYYRRAYRSDNDRRNFFSQWKNTRQVRDTKIIQSCTFLCLTCVYCCAPGLKPCCLERQNHKSYLQLE